MIAYNHAIKFIPELKEDKKLSSSFANTLVVKKSMSLELLNGLEYEMKFHNNQGRDLSLYTDRKFKCTVEGQLWALEVKDVITFFWHSGTLILEYIPHKNFTPVLLEYWCLHIILPVFFTIEETYDFLHAGAVEVEGKPILFIAESFGGKSTMTDFFMQRGHTMISDDKVASYRDNSQFFAVPSHPHHRPYRKMEDLGFFVKNFSSSPKPIHAIYELEKVHQNTEIAITEIKGIEKFASLRYSSETNLYFQKPKRFEYLMKMAKSVPVYKVKVPWKIERLIDVYHAIVKHSQNIKGFE